MAHSLSCRHWRDFQNINTSAWDVTSCRPVHVYTAAVSSNPTYTYTLHTKSSTSKSLAQNGEKYQNIILKGGGYRQSRVGSGAGLHQRKGMCPAKQVTSVVCAPWTWTRLSEVHYQTRQRHANWQVMSDSVTSCSDGSRAPINKHDLTCGGVLCRPQENRSRTTPYCVDVIITKWREGWLFCGLFNDAVITSETNKRFLFTS
jgi:hypothetical protein